MNFAVKSLISLAAVGIVACGSDTESEPVVQPEFGASDSLRSVQDQGTVSFGEERAGEFAESATFYGYRFEAATGGLFSVEVTQRGTSRGLDTTMFLFAKSERTNGWVELAFDDDDGWGKLSKIVNWEARGFDEYQIVIGTADGRGRGRFNVEFACHNDACDASDPIVEVCAFGDSYYNLFRTNPGIVVLSQQVLTVEDEMTSLEKQQVFDAIVGDEFDAPTLEAAFEFTDEGEVVQTRFVDASNRLEFVVYEYGAGDNSYGAIYEAESTKRVADIGDGDLYDCTVALGSERASCGANSDCADRLSCNGIVNGVGSCLDPTRFHPGEGDSCETFADCSSALVCAGESIGAGVCVPAWMKRRFLDEATLTISPGEVTERAIDVFGLASVSTDVNVSLDVFGPQADELSIILTNPTGTEVQLTGDLDDTPVLGFPGDEDANGTWTLRIENNGSQSATAYDFALEVTSRWD